MSNESGSCSGIIHPTEEEVSLNEGTSSGGNALIIDIPYDDVWGAVKNYNNHALLQYPKAKAFFDGGCTLPVDYLRGKKGDLDEDKKVLYNYCLEFAMGYYKNAMMTILKGQKVPYQPGATKVTIDSEKAFKCYYLNSNGSNKALAVGYYITFGWWGGQKGLITERFRADVLNIFSSLHPKVVMLPGRDNRSGNHFLTTIFTTAKTKCVDYFRASLLRAKGADNLRIWREYGSANDVVFCFEANCHYIVNTEGMYFCRAFVRCLY